MVNESGIIPLEYQVLVKPFEVKEKTDGGIYLPDNVREMEDGAVHEGELVALGGMAFERHSGNVWPERESGTLVEGATVIFSKYGGKVVEGNDGKKYRLMNDRDIRAIRSK